MPQFALRSLFAFGVDLEVKGSRLMGNRDKENKQGRCETPIAKSEWRAATKGKQHERCSNPAD
jgi:hypothetical protein